MVRGRSAEHPNPARPNATIPAVADPLGSRAIATRATAATNGRTWYVRDSGKLRSIAANRTRPTVTIAQNVVSATDAIVAVAPTVPVMYSVAQFPFMVSTTPYRRAKAAKSQNRDGSCPDVPA